jgi:hypothetical protein
MAAPVHIVHCIDTEGPLYEAPEVKYQRLNELLGITLSQPREENFKKLQDGELDFGEKGELARKIFTPHLSTYMDSWDKLQAMLDRATSTAFREKVKDSFGGGWVYNWFCMDHVGFVFNPRRRTIGYHAIFDFYKKLLKEPSNRRDGLHWHFHPMSTYKEGHRCATSLLNSPHIWESLARRIIERQWFPSCCRSGFQSERPDIHWFLEQFFPFDLTNTSVEDTTEIESQADLKFGRFGDWRLAPKNWGVYNPSHDNYQLPGNCRRVIARALNLLSRFANLDEAELEKAFIQAKEGRPTLLGVAGHDHRDLTTEVDHFTSMLQKIARKYPEVPFKFCEAREAMLAVALGGETGSPLELSLYLEKNNKNLPVAILIKTESGQVFGPQPFLAIKTRSQRFIHDNLDFSRDLKSWRYVFDQDSILPEDVAVIGVGACDKFGNTDVKTIKI